MPSPPVLNFEALLQPIPGESPAGNAVPFQIRHDLEKARKDEEDPNDPAAARKADWPGLTKLAQETLTNTSKDLLVAARLTEALVRLHGFAGLRDGLCLMREMVEKCWDRLLPSIEDGDLEVRAGPFHWLDDADKGARFPFTVRTVPLVASEEKRFGWLEWRQSQDGKGGVTREQFDKAVQTATREQCQTTAADIAACQEELNKLSQVLTAKLGPVAPALMGLRQAVGECQTLMQQILQRKGPEPAPAQEGAKTDGAKPATRPASAQESRAEVYQRLAQAADVLQKLEPHSPIPYLIKRCVDLGALSFPELIKELVRDAKMVSELNRELGIKEAPAKK